MAGMEDILMGGDSSSDSDAEDTTNKGGGTVKVTASTGAPTKQQQPSIVKAASIPPPVVQQVDGGGSGSKSDLTNRLKNLYSSPPVPPKVNIPPANNNSGSGVGQQQQNRPSAGGPNVRKIKRSEYVDAAKSERPAVTYPPASQQQQQQQQRSTNNNNNNSNFVPPMVHTNPNASQKVHGHHHQQQQQQQQRGPPPPVMTRVPAPLPKARTTSRSAPPSNRVASVPQPTQRSNSSSGSNRNMPTMPNGPPPPSPVVKQQSSSGGVSSRSQYAHAPHLGGGSSSSQRSSSQGMTAQQLQQQRSISSSSRSNAGMPPGIVTQPTSRSSSGSGSNSNNINMSDKEKKEKERFLMFTRVLMKYLEQRDVTMHANAKSQIKECYEKNKAGDPEFRSLTTSMKARLRETVGEVYWKKAHDYLDHFLKQKSQGKRQSQDQMHQGGGQPQHHPQPHPSHRSGVPPIVPQPSGSRQSSHHQQQQQQQHLMTQAQAQAAAAKKVPIPSAPRGGPTIPPSTIPVGAVLTDEQKKKKEEDEKAEKRRKRNEQSKRNRERKKREKEAAAAAAAAKAAKAGGTVPSKGVSGLPTGVGITHTVTKALPAGASPSVSSMQSSVSSKGKATSGSKAKDKKTATKTKDKKSITSKRSSPSSSITKKKSSSAAREPPHKLMETIDHATLIDVKGFPNLFNTQEYKMDVNLDEEQRILLYGDEKQQAKVKDITMAASAALDTAMDAESREAKFKEAGVTPLPTRIPSVYDGWGTKNVVSVRNAWAKVRLPESEMQRAEKQKEEFDKAQAERPMDGLQVTKPPVLAERVLSSSPSGEQLSSSAPAPSVPTIEHDTTNHVWFNEARAEQDPTLALLSEASEVFLKTTIEKAISKARLRQNLDGVRLWHTLQAHSNIPNYGSSDEMPTPPAFVRLGCDVRRQIALAEGNAAKVYQRMEEAISRQNDTYHANDSITDPKTMLLESTSMADLSKKPPLKSAAEKANAEAKRKFAVFVGSDMEPPLGRVPKLAKVTLQDIVVGELGNRTSMIASRRKRFRVGLKY